MFPLQRRGDLGKALFLGAAEGRVQNHWMGCVGGDTDDRRARLAFECQAKAESWLSLKGYLHCVGLNLLRVRIFRMWFMVLRILPV